MTTAARWGLGAVLRRPAQSTVRRLALLSLVANCGIVVTGGAVRLTASGLGCPTVPRCDESSYIPTRELGVHGAIEFGNRMLTFVITAAVLASLVAVLRARPRRSRLVRPAVVVALGVPAQAVLGAVTVLTGLNPWTVMAHFLLSAVLICVATVLVRRAGEGDGPAAALLPRPLAQLSRGVLLVTGVVVSLGTLVTGSGPHSGDPDAGRTGLDLAAVGQLHADAVMLLVGLTVALAVAVRAVSADARVVRAVDVLLAVELLQGAIGYVQWFTDLPVVLVGLHMLGATLTLVAATRLVMSTRERLPVALPEQLERDLAAAPA